LNGQGTGVTTFGNGYLFALDSNNGLKAFLINTNTLSIPFNITSVALQPNASVVLKWQSIAGKNYQVESSADLSGGSWSPLGVPVLATGTETSVTNSVSQPTQFFRVQQQ
jgi:hypothetical protein